VSGDRFLTPSEIDAAVAALSRAECRHVSRGRSGEGLGQRGGVYYRIDWDDGIETESPFADEAALRAFLAGLDLDTFSNRYLRWVLQGLGVL
jgi:hypothetical protein